MTVVSDKQEYKMFCQCFTKGEQLPILYLSNLPCDWFWMV